MIWAHVRTSFSLLWYCSREGLILTSSSDFEPTAAPLPSPSATTPVTKLLPRFPGSVSFKSRGVSTAEFYQRMTVAPALRWKLLKMQPKVKVAIVNDFVFFSLSLHLLLGRGSDRGWVYFNSRGTQQRFPSS